MIRDLEVPPDLCSCDNSSDVTPLSIRISATVPIESGRRCAQSSFPMPAATNRCPNCGADQPTDRPEGPCPACLARQAMTVNQPASGTLDATTAPATNVGGSLESTVESICNSEPSDQTIDY